MIEFVIIVGTAFGVTYGVYFHDDLDLSLPEALAIGCLCEIAVGLLILSF